jgi:hypothetical protein
MALDSRVIQLGGYHLEVGIEELERAAEQGRYNTMCIRALASAAMVLGQQDVLRRSLQLLKTAPDEAFWAGMITNIALPKTVPERMRTVDTLERLEKEHPIYSEDKTLSRIRSIAETESHLAICLEGDYQEARSAAKTGLQHEEAGQTYAILGKFDDALSVARDPTLEKFRQRGVLFVVVIEMFRCGRIQDAVAILTELESTSAVPFYS